MCGFAGFLESNAQRAPEHWPALLQRMGERLEHRGPDDAGEWWDAEAGIGLAHRRLSIIDLSPAGHQPMVSHSGRMVIVLNGEIYNHEELRQQLPRMDWRGHSDTETLLAAIEAWGIERALAQSIGMFAFALWDRGERRLFLARDRMGEKPLYYGWQGGVFLFGSQLKALKEHPCFAAEIDRDALARFMRYACIGAPQSIYRGIRKLTPGCWLAVSPHEQSVHEEIYWSLTQTARAGVAQPFAGTPEEAVQALESGLSHAIRRQQIADVPLGAFLSGGVDSSCVVALMQAAAARPIKTFTIGFCESDFNEAPYARAVAQHLHTEHTEMIVTAHQAQSVIPQLPQIWDEPFADSSQIPTYLVAQLARQHVTVALSGDAGDELFGGYVRYHVTHRLWPLLRCIPLPLRHAMAEALLIAVRTRAGQALLAALARPMGIKADLARLRKLAAVLATKNTRALYEQTLVHWHSNIVLGTTPLAVPAWPAVIEPLSEPQRAMLEDGLHYLPDDILAKVDRAAMAVGLETRVPFLDHELIALAWSFPPALLWHDGKGKWPLRALLEHYVPRALIERPKIGFGIPLAAWLRGALREWAEDLLDETRLRQEGFLDAQRVRRVWEAFLRGASAEYPLWNVLMFQAWQQQQNGR